MITGKKSSIKSNYSQEIYQ